MAALTPAGEQSLQFHLSIGAVMQLLRGALAGFAAWKWGGGCIGTILVFLLVYWLLGIVF